MYLRSYGLNFIYSRGYFDLEYGLDKLLNLEIYA